MLMTVYQELAKCFKDNHSNPKYPGVRWIRRDGEQVLWVKFPYDPEERKQVWKKLPHPFFRKHAQSPEAAVEQCYAYMSKTIFRYALCAAAVHSDLRTVYGIPSGEEHGEETEDCILFYRHEQYSYHDGGGGSRDSWCLRALAEKKRPPAMRMTKPYYAKRSIEMPPCDGYWEEDAVLYVKDPFGMCGVFELECESESWD